MIYEMFEREKRRPFVQRGDRLEAIVRGLRDGRQAAEPTDPFLKIVGQLEYDRSVHSACTIGNVELLDHRFYSVEMLIREHDRRETLGRVRARLALMGAQMELDALDALSLPEIDVLVYLERGHRTRDQAVPNGPSGCNLR